MDVDIRRLKHFGGLFFAENDNPVTHVISQTDSAAKELTDPVINHAERITKLEGDLGHMGEKLTNDLFDTERRLNEAISSGVGQQAVDALRDRITALESSLSELASKVTAPVVQGGAEEARTAVSIPAELTSEAVSGEPVKKEEPRGMHRRRKARRQR